ncbi:hypothetical protein BOO86_01390 [Mycobacterium sp. CBMA 234]|uniref:DUF4255 domain-containing protein n=1 Tax=Mycolicibacterium sp. CBMA 234 TaxID=1918495 RepID=UPI0012DD5D01|nr:DUF4255 domain-containing protein [Mycolicibacterium sp. CBMA 234]MUL63103.1 hypothetical protein [Mycolicibacterium sp. CBMA 234]
MSTALAIAATTRVLGSLIDQNIQRANIANVLGGLPPYVTTLAPDQLEAPAEEAAKLSLFLYHVTYNQGWREVGLPSRNSAGIGVDRPPLALDLHYLLIAYGVTDYVPQMLLGLGMQALHENPFLTRDEIATVFNPPPPNPTPLPPIDKAMASAKLDAQVEMIKVTPEPLTTEDLSKLWTAFGGKFRPSAGYSATVVLIESTAPIQSALPVTQPPNLLVVQFAEPMITAVTPQFVTWAPNPLSVKLTGTNLMVPGSVAEFSNNLGAPQTPLPVGNGASQATVTLPALPAGMNTVQIVQHAAIGAPPPKTVVHSNSALFYLQPVIRQDPNPPYEAVIVVGPVDHSTTPPQTPITVQLDPVLNNTQKVQLLLNELNPPGGAAPQAFTFDAAPNDISANSVTFYTAGVSGTYLVRVRVDGAATQLEIDTTTKAFVSPAVTL